MTLERCVCVVCVSVCVWCVCGVYLCVSLCVCVSVYKEDYYSTETGWKNLANKAE